MPVLINWLGRVSHSYREALRCPACLKLGVAALDFIPKTETTVESASDNA